MAMVSRGVLWKFLCQGRSSFALERQLMQEARSLAVASPMQGIEAHLLNSGRYATVSQ